MPSVSSRHYLIPPSGYFWRWNCEEFTAETSDGSLLCFSQELLPLLRHLAEEKGLPPLGSILIVIAVARNPGVLAAIEQASDLPLEPNSPVRAVRRPAFQRLRMIAELPESLRASQGGRLEILRAVFDGIFNRLPIERSVEAVDDLASLHPSTLSADPEDKIPMEVRMLRDFKALSQGLEKWTPEGLEDRLRTGIGPIDPDAAEIKMEWKAAPENLWASLQRSSDRELAALSAIAQQVLAILQLPRPVALSEDQPVGGVSDIASKGDPAHLLLSELAWDDLIFSVRLAHGEALYLRRESPPSTPEPQRIILLDNGIFLWGRSRIFATAIALALTRLQPGVEDVRLLGLDEGRYVPLALRTTGDLRDWWARLTCFFADAPALLGALREFTPDAAPAAPEMIWITHSETLREMQLRDDWKQALAPGRFFILTVDCQGKMTILQRVRNQLRLIREVLLETPPVLRPQPLPRLV